MAEMKKIQITDIKLERGLEFEHYVDREGQRFGMMSHSAPRYISNLFYWPAIYFRRINSRLTNQLVTRYIPKREQK